MDIEAVKRRYQMQIESSENLVSRLASRIDEFEREYDMSSAQMLAKVQKDTVLETEEVGRWMQDYLVLERISNGAGRRE